MLQRRLIHALPIALATAIGVSAQAQPSKTRPASPERADIEAARLHYRQGSKYYDLGRFLDAAHEYEAAFEAKEDAALLFNIGQAYRFAGENAKAIGAYKAYLRRDPKTKNRPNIEARIAELQLAVATQHEIEKAPPDGLAAGSEYKTSEGKTDKLERNDSLEEHKPSKAAETSLAREPSAGTKEGRTRRLAGIGLVAGGGVLAIAGVTLTALAYSLQSAQSNPGPNVRFDPSAPDRVRAEQISGGVLLGVGAGAIVTGTVAYLLAARKEHREHVVVAPLVGSSVGLCLQGVLR